MPALLHLIISVLLFVAFLFGFGLLLTARSALPPVERLCWGTALAAIALYLIALLCAAFSLPPLAIQVSSIAILTGGIFKVRVIQQALKTPELRQVLLLWCAVAGGCLLAGSLIKSYSGGGWAGDWLEHYQRAQFFARQLPADTLFISLYELPARPPLLNAVAGFFMVLTAADFFHYQIFATLLNSLVLLPAALLFFRFGGTPARLPWLAVLLLANPMFLENATFVWTKMGTAFFLLTGAGLLLAGFDREDHLRIRLGAVCLAAGILAHYSAVPYALVLAAVYLLRFHHRWSRAEFWSASGGHAGAALLLMATWITWSVLTYGWGSTLLSNTAADLDGSASALDHLSRIATNVANTLVPHPLRTLDRELIAQTGTWSYLRDSLFMIYQVNFPFAFGTVGAVLLALLGWERLREQPARTRAITLAALATVVLLSIATHSAPDSWGLAHIGLQPLVYAGLGLMAAKWRSLPPFLRWAGLAGLLVDLAFQGLHFFYQHVDLGALLAQGRPPGELEQAFSYVTWINFLGKIQFDLVFLADAFALPFTLGAATFLALLGALSLASSRSSRSTLL